MRERPADARYRFATDVTVRFAETDAQGVAHHAVFLAWFEVARVEYLARFDGGYPAMRAGGVEALTTEVSVRHGAAARFDDRLRVHARCVDVRVARFRFEYLGERDGETIEEGWTGHACVDARTLRPTRAPASFKDAIEKAES